jgi:hypothetical protein
MAYSKDEAATLPEAQAAPMHSAIRSWPLILVASLLFLVLPAGCLSGPEAPGSEKTCESNCDRQVEVGCSKTTADFAATCKQGCLVYRVDYPNCLSQMNAMSACVDRKVTFTCEPSGAISANPVAVCMNEEYACIDCTGDEAACRD